MTTGNVIEILNYRLTCLQSLCVRITSTCQVQVVHQEFDFINCCWHITRQLHNAEDLTECRQDVLFNSRLNKNTSIDWNKEVESLYQQCCVNYFPLITFRILWTYSVHNYGLKCAFTCMQLQLPKSFGKLKCDFRSYGFLQHQKTLKDHQVVPVTAWVYSGAPGSPTPKHQQTAGHHEEEIKISY